MNTTINDGDEVSLTNIGYTVGVGVDYAMTDNIILSAEYRHNDFGKKDLTIHDVDYEGKYKSSEAIVGIAFK